jgi:hypothetical protein
MSAAVRDDIGNRTGSLGFDARATITPPFGACFKADSPRLSLEDPRQDQFSSLTHSDTPQIHRQTPPTGDSTPKIRATTHCILLYFNSIPRHGFDSYFFSDL